MYAMQVVLGFTAMAAVLYTVSENRSRIQWKSFMIGMGLQFVLAILLLKLPAFSGFFIALNKAVQVIEAVSNRASQFMFGYLAGATPPFEVTDPGQNFIIAFQILPMIMVISALSALLFHWRVLPLLIEGLSKLITKSLKIDAVLGFGAAATVFFGTIESALVVRPYLSQMSRSNLFALITSSMATISGTVLVLYASVLKDTLPEPTTHLLVASLLSVPVAIVIAKALIPGKAEELLQNKRTLKVRSQAGSSLEALIQGTLEGLDVVLKVAAFIVVLFALIYLTDEILAALPFVPTDTTLISTLAIALRPVFWLTGMHWGETSVASELMATKIMLNEFVAYLNLGQTDASVFSPRSFLILTYALCGFANMASVGIVIGGLSTVIPERKQEVSQLCMKALFTGNLTTLCTGMCVGVVHTLFQ